MAGAGSEEIGNPSMSFSSGRDEPVPGSSVFPASEGTRPVSVEIQALTVRLASGATPRRAVVGWDSGRSAMSSAVSEARCGSNFSSAEVYLNVAGGYRSTDPAADLAVAAASVSASADRPSPAQAAWFGEISSAGEVRPVAHSSIRLKESAKSGFSRAYGPDGSIEKVAGLSYAPLRLSPNLVDRIEILAVAAWCISSFAVHYSHEPLTQSSTPYSENETGGGVLAFVSSSIVPYGITRFIARRIGSASRNSVSGPIDRSLGFGFGAVKGFIIVVSGFSISVFGYDVVWGVSGRPMWISQARTYPFLNAASEESMTMIADRRAAAEADAKADEAAKAKKDKAAAHKKAAKKSGSRQRADTSADKED
ncbi:hypothetical protein OY671_007681 [Metschnikowia pulcherrima]|nr:hypothetical protein OY671_007681 [Metschnikowia pulcherrima]